MTHLLVSKYICCIKCYLNEGIFMVHISKLYCTLYTHMHNALIGIFRQGLALNILGMVYKYIS